MKPTEIKTLRKKAVPLESRTINHYHFCLPSWKETKWNQTEDNRQRSQNHRALPTCFRYRRPRTLCINSPGLLQPFVQTRDTDTTNVKSKLTRANTPCAAKNSNRSSPHLSSVSLVQNNFE